MFDKYSDKLMCTNYKFIKKSTTVVGSISMLQHSNFEFPSNGSSTDIGTRLTVMKLYSEFLERINIGYHFGSSSIAVSYDLVNNRSSKIELDEISYGVSRKFVYVDTTGTAARNNNSKFVIKKAISELIEKNELFLFWYHSMGIKIDIDESISKKIHMHDIAHYENMFFVCKNLSNWPTVIHILCKDSKIVSTGIACDPSVDVAIDNAIRESKTIRALNMIRNYGTNKSNEQDNFKAYKYLTNFEGVLDECIELREINNIGIKLAKWIQNLNITVINRKESNAKIVTAYSKSLMKCLPKRKNLKYINQVEINRRYKILNIEEQVDCIIM